MCILDRITKEQKEQGKSQKDLCEYLGLTKNTFTEWKSGRNTSYKKYLPEIAEFLGVSVDYLLGKTENKKPSPAAAEEEEQDMAFSLSKYMETIKNQEVLMFDGEPLDDESRELLLLSLENTKRLAQKLKESRQS